MPIQKLANHFPQLRHLPQAEQEQLLERARYAAFTQPGANAAFLRSFWLPALLTVPLIGLAVLLNFSLNPGTGNAAWWLSPISVVVIIWLFSLHSRRYHVKRLAPFVDSQLAQASPS